MVAVNDYRNGDAEDVTVRNANAVTQYRAGKMQTCGFLVGQMMKGSKDKANPKLANDLLKRVEGV